MKSKLKIALLGVVALTMLTACKRNEEEFAIKGFDYAYQTSEVQEVTHDCYLARCQGDIYVEVPETYYHSSIKLTHTSKMIYYRIYSLETKVCNKGWEYKNG